MRNAPIREDQWRSALKSKGLQIKQSVMPILTGMRSFQKASKFQNSFNEKFVAKGLKKKFKDIRGT